VLRGYSPVHAAHTALQVGPETVNLVEGYFKSSFAALLALSAPEPLPFLLYVLLLDVSSRTLQLSSRPS
jgi:hypothetical protein